MSIGAVTFKGEVIRYLCTMSKWSGTPAALAAFIAACTAANAGSAIPSPRQKAASRRNHFIAAARIWVRVRPHPPVACPKSGTDTTAQLNQAELAACRRGISLLPRSRPAPKWPRRLGVRGAPSAPPSPTLWSVRLSHCHRAPLCAHHSMPMIINLVTTAGSAQACGSSRS